MTGRSDRALLAACSAFYLLIATRLGGGLLRTQFDNGAYSQFFDIQAQALRRGNLSIPANSIGNEAFIVDGSQHMYFGLFPALLRLPVLEVSDAWFGELTVLSSFLAWLLFVVSAWGLADRVLDRGGEAGTSRLVRPGVTMVWKAGIALGTPMLMLAGPAWVFSEAIMWGVAAAVLFQWRLYRELEDSSVRNQLWLGAALLLAVLNRPTLGIGCLLVLIVVVGVRARRGLGADEYRLGGFAALSAIALVLPNMIRFGQPLGPPMERQLLSQIDQQRMLMLNYAGGDFVDPRYTPSNLLAYLRPDGVSISSRFPFIESPTELPHVFSDAVYDITYRTPSLLATSTLLVVLAAIGSVSGLRSLRSDVVTRRLVLAAGAGLPAALTLFVWGFIAPRYLADFIVLLLPLSLLGTRCLAGAMNRTTSSRRAWLATATIAVLAWSIAANTALAVSSSYLTGPDGGASDLVDLQGRGDFWTSDDVERFDSVDDLRFDRTDPPNAGRIAILGDCDAAYLSTGEPVDPWLTLGYGPNEFRRTFAVTLPPESSDASVMLGSFVANEPGEPPNRFELHLVTDNNDPARLELSDEFGVVRYPLDVRAGAPFELTVTSDPVRQSMFFDIDGRTAHYGHYLTRSLFGVGGQTVEFTDGGADGGVVVDVLGEPTRRC